MSGLDVDGRVTRHSEARRTVPKGNGSLCTWMELTLRSDCRSAEGYAFFAIDARSLQPEELAVARGLCACEFDSDRFRCLVEDRKLHASMILRRESGYVLRLTLRRQCRRGHRCAREVLCQQHSVIDRSSNEAILQGPCKGCVESVAAAVEVQADVAGFGQLQPVVTAPES